MSKYGDKNLRLILKDLIVHMVKDFHIQKTNYYHQDFIWNKKL